MLSQVLIIPIYEVKRLKIIALNYEDILNMEVLLSYIGIKIFPEISSVKLTR